MNKFCTNCGKELKEGAEVCLNCGVIIKNQVSSPSIPSNKIPGNGKSIAGMVLGIVATFFAILEILSSFNIESALLTLPDVYYDYSVSFILFWFGVGYVFLSFIPSVIGLPLSISGLFKHKNGKNIAGVVLNSFALVISIILFVYIMSIDI